MFFMMNFVVVLVGILVAIRGKELSDEKVTDERVAEQWLQEMNEDFGKTHSEAIKGAWNYYTNITNQTLALKVD